MRNSSKQSPTLSVIIPSHREQKHIAELLADLERQTFKDFEVILVDTMADLTSNIAKTFSSTLDIKIVDAYNRKGVARQRNIGAKIANSDNLLFLDADGRFFHNSLEIITSLIKNESPTIILPIMLFKSKRPIDFIASLVVNSYTFLISLFKTRVPGSFLYIDKLFFNKEGGFNEDMDFEEDFDLTQRIGKSGGRLVRLWTPVYRTSTRTFDTLGRPVYFAIQIWNGIVTLFPNKIKDHLLISYELGGGKSSKLKFGSNSTQSKSNILNV